MITVTIWHNVAFDGQGRHVAMLDGYQPGDPVVRVFAYQADPAGRSPEAIAEEAFAICNGHPRDAGGEDLSRRYYERELRSLSVGDIVSVGEIPLAVGTCRLDPGPRRPEPGRQRRARHPPHAGTQPPPEHRRPHGHCLPRSRSDLMTIRKPNRVTTPKRAVLNGTRTSHASMPRARGRWRPDVTWNRASTPGRGRRPARLTMTGHGGDVKVRFGKIGYPLYCDAGPYAGQMRIDLTIRLYLTPEEYATYEGSESPQITLHESGGGTSSPAAPLNLPGNCRPGPSWHPATSG
jgi:hypothetical protein